MAYNACYDILFIHDYGYSNKIEKKTEIVNLYFRHKKKTIKNEVGDLHQNGIPDDRWGLG